MKNLFFIILNHRFGYWIDFLSGAIAERRRFSHWLVLRQ